MTNSELFWQLYNVHVPNTGHLKIFRPNLSFLKVFIDTFEFVKHQNHSIDNRNFDYPIMMAKQFYMDKPKIMCIGLYSVNDMKFWFDTNTKHAISYIDDSLELRCRNHSVNFRMAHKHFKLPSRDFNKIFNDELYYELCKNFPDCV